MIKRAYNSFLNSNSEERLLCVTLVKQSNFSFIVYSLID